MKVLHCSPNHPPEFRGGVERFLEALLPALQAAGIDGAVLAGSDVRRTPGSISREVQGGIAVFRVHRAAGDDHTVDLRHPDLRAAFDRVVDEVRPALLHVHHWHNLGAELVRWAAARGLPAVVTLHDAWVTCPRFHRIATEQHCERPFDVEGCGACLAPIWPGSAPALRAALSARDLAVRLELAIARAVLVPSRAAEETIRGLLPGAPTMRVVPLAVPAMPPRAPYQPPSPGEPFRIGSFGSVVPEKGLHLLLAACTRLAAGFPVELHLHGNEPDANYVARLCAADPRGLLRRHGPYAPAALPALAQHLHVAAFASICRETFGLAVEEALHLRLPVVVAARGAPAERVGEGGIVLPPEDGDALVDCLRTLRHDPARLRALAAARQPLRDMADVARDHAGVYAAALTTAAPEADAAALLAASQLFRRRPDLRVRCLSDLEELLRELRAGRLVG